MVVARSKHGGFTLIELVVIIVVLGILAAVALPKYVSVVREAEEASVDAMVSNLESALSMHVAKCIIDGQPMTIHNPFDDLSNIPSKYNGVFDPVTTINTENGTWSWRPSGNWVMYNPSTSITGGWNNGGERFIIYQVQTVLDGTDTVGLRLTTTPAYAYDW